MYNNKLYHDIPPKDVPVFNSVIIVETAADARNN
jgi:hypothetical protein